MRLLKIKTVAERIDMSTVTIRRWVADGKFPAPVTLPNGDLRWHEFEVMMWISQQVRATDSEPPSRKKE